MAITEFRPQDQNQNPSQAPTLGEQSGTFGANAQQRRNINQQGGSGRFTNLQQYVQANEANNPNARLLQREAQTRQGELGTKQAQYSSQANPLVRTGLETIKSGQQFVQSALQDPTQYVTPERLQQFSGYRQGGTGNIESIYNQLNPLKSGLTSEQERIASGLESIKSSPTAIQNFIQSQRVNPALATRGENVLDRFLTQSTQSGQEAITGLGTAAGAIRQAQAPSIPSEIEALKTQVQAGPLTNVDINNLITAQTNPEEDYLKGINKEEVYRLSGISPDKIAETESIINQYNKSKKQYEDYLSKINRINSELKSSVFSEYSPNVNQTANPYSTRFNIPSVPINFSNLFSAPAAQQSFNEAIAGYFISNLNKPAEPQGPTVEELAAINDVNKRQQLSNLLSERTSAINEANKLVASGADVKSNPLSQKYKTFEQYYNPQTTREQLLQGLDPTRLSRIQALQQLAGTTQFNPLLQQRLA
jgi:hypothetical protein